ncbi:MAG: DUF4129 domain-containing protein [Ardenticatenaceae bacterium]|nr:DUF4129 domain-containing protein [Ardenticatenaceae bacterium]
MFTDTFAARAFRALLVTAMMLALAEVFLGAVRVLVPEYAPWWFLPAVALVTLEALASSHLGERLALRGRDWLIFRLVEFGVLVLLLRLLTLIDLSFDQFRAILAEWAWHPTTIFDVEFTVLLLLLAVLWQATMGIATDLALLELRPGDLDARGRPFRGEWARGDRNTARNRLVQRFFWGGALLLIFAGLPRLQLIARGGPSPFSRAAPVAAIGYFIAGLTLLSQAHLALMQLDWLSQDLHVDERLIPRWRGISLALIALVAVVVALLPTSYAGGLLAALQAIVALIGFVAYLVVNVLLILIALPFAFLLWLLRGQSSHLRLPPPPPLPEVAAVPAGNAFWFEALRMILFWSLLFGVVGYILREYLRTHGVWLDELRRLPLLARLLVWLEAFWQWVHGRRRAVAARLTAAVRAVSTRRSPDAGRSLWPRLRLGRLSPRERVRYFYLSHLNRAAQGGRPRRPAQTPAEYADELRPELGQEAADWQVLTEAFVRARYAPDPLAAADVGPVQAAWQRLKRALRALQARSPR